MNYKFLNFKLIFFLIIFLGIFGVAKSSFAATYYVDFQNGNDDNNGFSVSSAWKHCPGDNNAVAAPANANLTAGDIVYFKKGVTYVGQIVARSGGTEVDSGEDGTVTKEGIVNSTGKNFLSTTRKGDWIYIYNKSTSGAYNNSVGFFQIASVDSNTRLTLVAYDGEAHTTAELPYKIWRPISFTSIDGWGMGDAIISGNSTYYYAIRVQNDYLLISNLKFIDGKWPTGYPGPSCTNDAGGAIWDNSGTTTGLIVSDCKFNNWWVASYVLSSPAGYFVLRNNELSNIGSLGLVGSNYSLMENNKITDTGSAIRGAGKYSIVRFNTITDCVHPSATYCGTHSDGIGPFFSASADPGGNQYGWIYGNYIANTVMGIFLDYNNGGTSHWTILSNALVGYYGAGGSGSSAIMVNDAPFTKVFNNTVFGLNGSTGWASSIKFQKTNIGSPNCELKNNIISADSTISVADAESQVGFASEGNIIYAPNNQYLIWSTNKTWAEWQNLGMDSAGYSYFGTAPGFVDPVGMSYQDINLMLKNNSTFLASPYSLSVNIKDVAGKLMIGGSNWTRGAYQNFMGDQTDTTPPVAPQGLSVQ